MECRVGKVMAIRDEAVEVLITRESACAGCHAKGACTSQDRRDQVLLIEDFPMGLQVGDPVRIIAKSAQSMRAVLLAFVFPLLLLISTAVALNANDISEDVMLLALMGILILYALVLVALRPYLKRTLTFKVEPLQSDVNV